MKTALRSACVAVLLLALAATASPAMAKGPTEVSVTGPGVDAQLSYRHAGNNVDLGRLADAARTYHHWDGSGLAPSPELTADQLGPRFVLTWTVGRSAWGVQHAYPFAEGGAWVRFVSVPGEGPGGWLRVPALTEQLVALGAVEEASPSPVAATTEETAVRAEPRASEPAGRSSYGVLVPVGLALVVVLGAGALIVRRRLSR